MTQAVTQQDDLVGDWIAHFIENAPKERQAEINHTTRMHLAMSDLKRKDPSRFEIVAAAIGWNDHTVTDPQTMYAITDESGEWIFLGPFHHEALARKAFKAMAPTSSEPPAGVEHLRLVRVSILDSSTSDLCRETYRRRLANETALLKLAGEGMSDAFVDWVIETWSTGVEA